MADSEALQKELLECFELEARDHIGALSSLLLSLERETDPAEQARLVESVFRRVHTLKGAAHAVNLIDVAHDCQELESLLVDLKHGDLSLEIGLFDRLHRDVDALSGQVAAAREEYSSPAHAAAIPAAAIPEPPAAAPARGSRAKAPFPPRNAPVAATPASAPKEDAVLSKGHGAGRAPDDTVRVSTRLLEALLLQSEELVAAKLAASALHEELSAAAGELAARADQRSRELELARKALKSAKPEAQGGLAGLVEHGCQRERLTEGRLRLLERRAEKHLWALQAMIDPLMQDMKKLHLLPFSSLTDPFSKLSRDLARQLDKEAELECRGGELELDRRILDQLKEPLLHLVRNMVDHGIEKPAERNSQGKPEKGSILIDLRLQDANRAELLISDDGCGIDLAQVKATALGQEIATQEALQRLSDQDALQLIFESGVSTSRIISSISGRGLGLAIVREALERLGGHVTVESCRGVGTSFRLSFPLSFAMMRGLLVAAGGRDCVIPAANVEQSCRVQAAQVRRVENRDTVLVDGEVVALANLARVLGLGWAERDPDEVQTFVVLHAAGKRIAFAVDGVSGVQEILVKPLGRQLARVRNVAGATVLGSGRVVPVLNVADLFRSALLDQAPSRDAAAKPSGLRAERLSVLVAEDSITSRTLLKNILESAGYLVRTAIDGLDAITQLKTESFDIVISDVEMPRMDGFQLTAAIRGDSRFASLPVILVTGLESRADRERGIDVGASAYLVKSSFDQGSLIDVIRKLT